MTPSLIPSAFAGEPAPAAALATAAKTHVLFMGADITVERNKEFHPVETVTASDIIIKPAGKLAKVPLSEAANLRINESLKMADLSVAIDHLSSERAYSLNADPFLDLARSTSLAAGESALADLANRDRLQFSMGGMGAGAKMNVAKGTPAEAEARAGMAQAQANMDSAEAQMVQIYNTPQAEVYSVASQSVKTAGEPMYDAIRLTFEVTARNNLPQPYYAVIALIRDHDSTPRQVRKWAYVKALSPMNAGDTRNVMVYRSGLPPGYILENTEVHFYNGGQELSSNLSRKRVSLTDDEAQEYRIFEYLGANKKSTLPAALMTTTLAGATRFTLTKTQLDDVHYVRVTKDGTVAAVFRDAAGKEALQDPALEPVLRTLHFKPALKEGKPVESVVPISLGQLATAGTPEK